MFKFSLPREDGPMEVEFRPKNLKKLGLDEDVVRTSIKALEDIADDSDGSWCS